MLPYGAPYLIGDAAGARLLVAVGDDRIAHALVAALVGPDGPRHPEAVLGLVGLGRQNLAATFGLPEDTERAAAHLLGSNLFLADVGRARWHGPKGSQRVGVFGNCAALGGLAATRSTPARLALERGAVDFRLAGLVVANGQFTMHRMKVAPRALPDDGRMSVIAFEGQPLTIYSRSKELYYGEHIPHPTIREYQSKLIEVDTAEPLTIALDGCRVPGTPPLTVDVLPEALRIKV